MEAPTQETDLAPTLQGAAYGHTITSRTPGTISYFNQSGDQQTNWSKDVQWGRVGSGLGSVLGGIFGQNQQPSQQYPPTPQPTPQPQPSETKILGMSPLTFFLLAGGTVGLLYFASQYGEETEKAK